MENKIVLALTNELGLHARAAAAFVKTVSKFDCEVSVKKNGTEVNGKSIMGLIMLAAPKNAVLEIKAEGKDSKECLEELRRLIENRFGEDK